jgi:hypothetical protein
LPVEHTPAVDQRSTILRTASIPESRRIPGVAMAGATVAVVPVVEDFITV